VASVEGLQHNCRNLNGGLSLAAQQHAQHTVWSAVLAECDALNTHAAAITLHYTLLSVNRADIELHRIPGCTANCSGQILALACSMSTYLYA